ncbi:MAG: iron ABC transporter permease [Thalassobaculaceae bacterium]|nr:iron ABC transporter permease [Thalassobaculaceae bacterium]
MAPRERQAAIVLAGCAGFLVLSLFLALGIGAVPIPPDVIGRLILNALGADFVWETETRDALVFWSIRVPRVAAGCLVGASLAMAGATMQGIFRNPLADPALIGVSSGAALAAVAVIVVGGGLLGTLPPETRAFALPVAALFGGLAATAIVYRLGSVGGQTMAATTLLAGVAISAIAQAGIGFLIFLSDEQQLRDLSFWTLGSVAGLNWPLLLPAAVLMVVPILVLPRLAGALNAMLLGERESFHMGHDPQRVKRLAIGLTAVAVGGAVSVSGVIGFVGLVVPHIVRLLAGPDHRWLLPGTALLGASLFLMADLLARMIVLPSELPIGVVTALVGGPFFIWLLVKRKDWG